MFCKRLGLSVKLATLLVLALTAMPAQAQIGILFTGPGPVNRSMGGAATAAPLDASGALYWNPATISGLPSSSIDFGVDLLYPQTRLASSITGLGAGSDRGDNGVFAIPTMAVVYRPDDSALTYGLGVFTVGGFGTNYPTNPTNPILTAQPPFGIGVGPLYTNFQVLELTPTVSVQVTDRLSIGGGPTLAMAHLEADPLLIASPNLNGQFATGTHTRMSFGGGFQAGAFYKLDGGWNVGASIKSTQWMEGFHWQSVDARGLPRNDFYRFNVPMIVSTGIGYTGIERWTFATDFRYVDYRNTEGFKQTGFTPTGALAGLGWRNVFAMSLGAQYQMSDALSLRGGYSYNQNPIVSDQASANIASPTILEHTIYLGASYNVTESFSLSLAYVHCFQNSVEGKLVTPAGPVPGSTVRSTVSADALIFGATVKFGPRN